MEHEQDRLHYPVESVPSEGQIRENSEFAPPAPQPPQESTASVEVDEKKEQPPPTFVLPKTDAGANPLGFLMKKLRTTSTASAVATPPASGSSPAGKSAGTKTHLGFQPPARTTAAAPAPSLAHKPTAAVANLEFVPANVGVPLQTKSPLAVPQHQPRTDFVPTSGTVPSSMVPPSVTAPSQPISFIPAGQPVQGAKQTPSLQIPEDHPWVAHAALNEARQTLRARLRNVYVQYLQRCADEGKPRKPIYAYEKVDEIFGKITSLACIPDYEDWRPWKYAPRLQREMDDPVFKCRAYTMSVLNIITSENYDDVSNKLLTYEFHSADDFREMSFCLHDKALFDLRFQDLYAKLVRKLNEHAEAWAQKFAIVSFLDEENSPAGAGYYFRTVGPHDDPDEYNWIGPSADERQAEQQCIATFSIRKKIIDKAHEFMKQFPDLVKMGRELEELQQRLMNRKSETGETLTPEEENELETKVGEMDYEYQKLKKSHIANISFMGHLYRYNVIFEGMIGAVLRDIYNMHQGDPNFEIIEALCSVLTLAGKTLESRVAMLTESIKKNPGGNVQGGVRLLLEYYPKAYELLEGISNDTSIPFRRRAVILDLLDLKNNNWVVQGHLGTVVHTTESLSRQEMRSRVEAEERAQRDSLLGKSSRGKYDGRATQSQDFRRSDKGGLRASKAAAPAKSRDTQRDAVAATKPVAAPSEQYIITPDEGGLRRKMAPSWRNFAEREGGYIDLYDAAKSLSKNDRAGYNWVLSLLTDERIKVDNFVKGGKGLAFLASQNLVSTRDIINALLHFFGGKDSVYADNREDLPNIDLCVTNALLGCLATGHLTFAQLNLALSSLLYLDEPRYCGFVLLVLIVKKLTEVELNFDDLDYKSDAGSAPSLTTSAKDTVIEDFQRFDEVHKLVAPSLRFRMYMSCFKALKDSPAVVKDSTIFKHMEAAVSLLESTAAPKSGESKDPVIKDAEYYVQQWDEMTKKDNEVCKSAQFVMTIFTHYLYEILDSLPTDSSPETQLPGLIAPSIPLFEKMFKDVYGADESLTRVAVDVADAVQLASMCAPPTKDAGATTYMKVLLNCFLQNKAAFIDTLHLQKWLDLRADGIYQPYGRAEAEIVAKEILGSTT